MTDKKGKQPTKMASNESSVRSKDSDKDVERAGQPQAISLWQYLMQDVDPKQTTGPLAAYCFMTGYMCALFAVITVVVPLTHFLSSDVISFSAIFVWCGFQTGNFAQVRFVLPSSCQSSTHALDASVTACSGSGSSL